MLQEALRSYIYNSEPYFKFLSKYIQMQFKSTHVSTKLSSSSKRFCLLVYLSGVFIDGNCVSSRRPAGSRFCFLFRTQHFCSELALFYLFQFEFIFIQLQLLKQYTIFQRKHHQIVVHIISFPSIGKPRHIENVVYSYFMSSFSAQISHFLLAIYSCCALHLPVYNSSLYQYLSPWTLNF